MTEGELHELERDAEELYNSVEPCYQVDILVEVEVDCPFCEGTGKDDGDFPVCSGTGVGFPGLSRCNACRGRGYFSPASECEECDGSGVALINVTEWQETMLEAAGKLRRPLVS